jgi:methylase of polypeptide subunit release factors
MNRQTPPSHFCLETMPDLAPLREALRQAEFTANALSATIAVQNPSESLDLPMVMLRTEEPTPYNTLARLFILGQVVPESSARSVLCPMAFEPLLDGHLLRRAPDGISSTVKLAPYDQFYFVSDFSHKGKADGFSPDFVLGVGPASLSLATLTVRKPVETAFDLGAGAGVQSILASGHAKKIVGTDTNPRALNFALFNARLNGIENIEWRAGSFFEPVKNDQFDLVMANPPFVISPESSLLYRDGGGEGDAVSEHIVRGAARRLNEGGFASMLINWHHKNGDDWNARPLQWMADNGCDSWLMRFTETDPVIYAANWLRQTEGHDPARYDRLLRQWTEYYREAGIGRISGGGVILRKRSCAKNWTRHDSMQNTGASGSCADHILRIFAAEDFLQGLESDEEFLNQRLQPHPDLAVDQHLVLHEGAWTMQGLTINLSRGLPFPGHADIHVLKLLANTIGQRTVREAISALAQETATAADKITPTCLNVLRTFVRLGMLVPAGAPV